MEAAVGFIVYGISAISIGSIGLIIGKGSSILGIRAISYHFIYKSCKKIIKKGIMERDFHILTDGIRQLKNFDIKFQTNKTTKIFRLFNINEEIISDIRLFNKFYKISNYDFMTEKQRQDIVNRYMDDNELSVIDPNRVFDEFFNKSDEISELDNIIENITD